MRRIVLELLFPPRCPFCDGIRSLGGEAICENCQKKIKYIKNQNTSPEVISKKIASSGGTSVLGVVLTIVLELLLSAIIFVGLMYL